MRISTGYIHKSLLYFLVVFIVFDGFRSNLTFADLISPFRELALNGFILLCLPYLRNVKTIDIKVMLPFIFLSIFAIINIPVTLGTNLSDYITSSSINIFQNKYSAVYKHILFSLIIISLIVYFRKNILVANKSISLFVSLASFYSLITLPIYLYGFPFFRDNFRDWGRMGIGYPTMDGQMICFAIFCLVFILKKQNLFIFNFKMALLLLGLVEQNTGTSMVTMLVIIVLCFIYKPLKTTSYFIFAIPIVVLIIIKQYVSNPDFFSDMIFVANNKLQTLFNPDLQSQSNLDTLNIRTVQFEALKKILDQNSLFWFFGIGGDAYIESEYNLTRAAYGIFAYVIFVLSFVWIPCAIFFSANKNKILIISFILMWALTSYTLASIHLFTTSFGFALIFAYLYVNGRIEKNDNLVLEHEKIK